MKKQTKSTNLPQDKVSEVVATYEKTISKKNAVPEGYSSSEYFWKQQVEKTKEFCKKNGIL